MTSLTDRYVDATVRDLDQAQRHDVERELRTTIEDMVDARVRDGAGDRAVAEREVLLELGDPMRLAADYAGRPLDLVGPRAYPQWRRVTTLLLSTLTAWGVLRYWSDFVPSWAGANRIPTRWEARVRRLRAARLGW